MTNFFSRKFNNPNLEHKKKFHKNLRTLDKKFISGEFKKLPLFVERVCVVCSKADFKFLFKALGCYDYCRCTNCGMVAMNPLPTSDNLHELYNSEEMSFNASGKKLSTTVSPAGRNDYKYILKFIQQGKLLDIGCGVGGFMKTAKKSFDVEGLEINSSHAKIGIRNDLKIHNTYSGEYMPTYKYDLVTMLQVIEHVESPRSVIEDAYRLLDKGGLFYIACPNFDSVSLGLFKEKHRHVSSFAHINMYNPEALKRQLRDVGFECLNLETYMLDITLHDLYYCYFLSSKFSHRFSNYNGFTYSLFTKLFRPFKNVIEQKYIRKEQGSYLRGIFRKV